MPEKIAVVTGGNKGIGYAIVQGLCEKFNGKVYLTARNVSRGEAAVAKLKGLGLNPLFHQLDITDQESITKFKNHIVEKHGGIDLLVNNAGIYKSDESKSESAKMTIDVNYFGTLKVCETLFPILRKNARVVNLSSALGHLSKIPSAELRAKFSDPALTVSSLNKLMDKFIKDSSENKREQEGWGNSAYVVSKVGVSALTLIQQRDFDKETPNRNITVNCCHPGYIDTDLSNHKGPMTIYQGAKAPLYLALENHNLKGKYIWYDTKVVDWFGTSTPGY